MFCIHTNPVKATMCCLSPFTHISNPPQPFPFLPPHPLLPPPCFRNINAYNYQGYHAYKYNIYRFYFTSIFNNKVFRCLSSVDICHVPSLNEDVYYFFLLDTKVLGKQIYDMKDFYALMIHF